VVAATGSGNTGYVAVAANKPCQNGNRNGGKANLTMPRQEPGNRNSGGQNGTERRGTQAQQRVEPP